MSTQRFPDLRAEIHSGSVPRTLSDELPDLYSSLPCTLEWLIHHDRIEPDAACVLDDPRHVLLVCATRDTIEVLNKTFPITPADAARGCEALFRAFPSARRIHLEVMFPPTALRLHRRALNWTDHWVVPLPGSVEDYTASLGKSTRQNLRKYENRLRRDHPDVSVRTLDGERSAELFDRFLTWKRERFTAQGRTTMWDSAVGLSEGFVELARSRGEIQVATSAGEDISILFAFAVGHSMYGAQAAFRPDYERYHLGLLALYWLAGDAIERGLTELNLMWGTGYYKERLGARPARATRISVFRTQAARLHSLDEGADIALRELRSIGQNYYWRARHVAGRGTRAMLKRVKSGARDPEA